MQKTSKISSVPLDLLYHFGYNTHMENNTTMSNFDDNFNIDLPGEIEDLHDENCEWEPVLLPDDDSEPDICWNDADSFTSIGWGTDEDYGCFDDGGEW
tara:strand:- start:358 stop:651 length:294 start_codon:yes stop_codon:yes gene_type:complete